jgi:hypothetical protein
MQALQKLPTPRRKSGVQWSLKPQDIAILLKLVCLRGQWLPYEELATQMHISQSEAYAAVQRLLAARLAAVGEDNVIRPVKGELHAFIYYGAAYFFPAIRTETTIGFPTAYGTSPLREQVLFANEFPPVWPHKDGDTRGPGLVPLYEDLPLAAQKDSCLKELLSLFDALRIGQARERGKAYELLLPRLA